MIDSIRMLVRRARRTTAGNVIKKPAFFLHVPKCGGTSVQVALEEAYGLRAGIKVDLRGNIYHSAFFRLNPYASKEAADQLGAPPHKVREHVLLYQMGCSRPRLISGHFHYSNAAYRGYHTTYTFITMIRDPVERWYSHYFYDRDKKGDYFSVEAPIDEYLDSPRGQATGSLIARYFAGSDCSGDDVVQHAITNIAKFHVVGILEHLGVFKKDLRRVLGADIDIPVRNAGPTTARQRRKEITPEIHRAVVEACRPDKKVYDYVLHNIIGNAQQP